ncbi:MAG: glycogen debranching protein GlgX [Actinomycetaceae bacterium]|nr:glycogen debranching protein GlgX [Actinomycetaceae bacterium]MDY5854585.1 glycogen debranching protein GlgX [Arcanobacterium sp.]
MTFQPLPPSRAFEPRPAERTEPPRSPWSDLGVYLVEDGVDVAVVASQATNVEICFFDDVSDTPNTPRSFTERRFRLRKDLYGIWKGHITGISAGHIYGFRADGPWDPEHGLFYNPAKVMLDPYARAVARMPILHSSLYAHKVDSTLHALPGMERDTQDSAPFAALGQVSALPPKAPHIHVPWEKTIIYEGHVVGLTKEFDAVPPDLRGTYAGVAHPAMVDHLKHLGVTTLELLPIFAKMPEPFLTLKGLTNYWGYNTLNFFCPEPSYATARAQAAGPEAILDEVRGMVSILHQAGIEVVLDVVYNHTNEAGVDGPSTSFRGLDNTGYYRYDSFNQGALKDTTGCGNSLDFRRTAPVQLTLDSLRYWVEHVGIDGFRFDLAVTLGREGDSFNPHHPLFSATLNDPILRKVKLINEPWDVGPNGWQTGNFFAGTADWNDRFRDSVRSFWLTDPAAITAGGHGADLHDLATRIAGSADLFAHGRTADGRGVFSSINFVAAHDGFSLHDLVSYNQKHNEANLENNSDGAAHNHSWNHGVEGCDTLTELSDGGAALLAFRRHSARNLIGTLLLSAGTPMLRAGDELLKSQRGNNNSYCQDNSINYLQWNNSEHVNDFTETVGFLANLRAKHPVLHPARFYTGTALGADTLADAEWFDAAGERMPDCKWFDPSARVVQMLRSGSVCSDPGQADRDALIVLNGSLDDVELTLPQGRGWPFELIWLSSWENPRERDQYTLTFNGGEKWSMPALSLALFFS